MSPALTRLNRPPTRRTPTCEGTIMDARMGWLALLLAGSLATGAAVTAPREKAPARTMKAFGSEREFEATLTQWRVKAERERRFADKMAMAAPPAAVAASAESTSLDSVSVAGTALQAEGSITNIQTTGVDEGDIVKKHGDHLIVLRRGRLFTIRIGSDALQPVSAVDAHAPDADPSGTWYDEMLVSDGTVVVIGYSYARGGTEIGLFDLDASGGLRYRATYQLRSNDYYSARNYASRLIGNRLVFYTPLQVNPWRLDSSAFLPALRHWRHDATPRDFKRILPATRIYRTDANLDLDQGVALHTVSVCDLSTAPMHCESTAVLGPSGHVFYVSEDSVYVWATQWSHATAKPNASSVFRIPLDGSAPSALKASGSPIDQMSFLQRDGYLNVLVGSESDGEGMWASGSRAGELALLRVPLGDFGDGSTAARSDDYRFLPGLNLDDHELHNRYVGDWLIVGAGDSWGDRADGASHQAQAVRYAGPDPIQTLRLGHAVERIDALGRDAVLVGNRGDDLHFTSVRLGETARPASVYVQRDAAQGDERTHGFFYKPRSEDEGIVGLPIVGRDDSASVLYLRNRALRLDRFGRLDAAPRRNQVDDGCKASCVDWYGNARPIFIGERTFALLGYELVEGRLVEGVGGEPGIRERRRVDFSPTAPVAR